MNLPAAPSDLIASLRARIADGHVRTRLGSALPFEVEAIDRHLADRGLAGDGLHEVAPATPTLTDIAAATLFTAGATARFAGSDGVVLWAVGRFDLYAPGLEQAGLGPRSVLFVEAREDRQVLAAMEDALRHGGVAAVVGEVKRADMTASRRLQLAAADSGTPCFLYRHWRKPEIEPLAENSAAMTRWRIASAPSRPLGHPGVGRSRWEVTLARQRNGVPGSWIVEACDAEGRLALPAAPRDRAGATGRDTARAA